MSVTSADVFPCQYLYGSAECLIRAVSYYNNPSYGNVERSFSELQRAWNSLWMAEMQAQENGNINASNGKTYGIEDLVKDTIPIPNYDISLSHPSFQDICNPTSAIRANYYLFYQLRNINQHDFLELAKGSYSELVSLLNPYIIANFRNYLSTYKDIIPKVLEKCKAHRPHLRSGKCSKKELKFPSDIENFLAVPVSLKTIKQNEGRKVPLSNRENVYKYSPTTSKRLVNFLDHLINESKSRLGSGEDKTNDWRWKFPIDSNATQPIAERQMNKKVQDVTRQFPYDSLRSVAKVYLGFDDKVELTPEEKKILDSTRKKIQSIKEYYSNAGTHDSYWQDFWGKPRYSIDFQKVVAERLSK